MPQESSHPKLLCNHRVTVVHKEANPTETPGPEQAAILEEISVTSATVYLECPLRTGASVLIDCSTCELRGKVIGCHSRADGHLAAVQLEDDSRWSKTTFVPDELLNPNYLQCSNKHCTPECDSEECCGGSRAGLHVCI